MIGVSSLISCNFFHLPLNLKTHYSSGTSCSRPSSPVLMKLNSTPRFSEITTFLQKNKNKKKIRGFLQVCNSLFNAKGEDPSVVPSSSEENGSNGDGGGGEERDWTTSFLLFAFWAGLMYYVFFLAPNQTPSLDLYFLKKLLNLKGDDGFEMNQVLVALWYIMGLWPLVYSMLLLPNARSSKSKIPLWPFLTLSFFGGAFAIIPYFVAWRPPAPPVEESELGRWPLNFLESKVTAAVTMAAGLAILVYAGLSGSDVWAEFYQYFRGSRFIHVTSIDFSLLSMFAPFWVYNDMTVRKWEDKGSWLLPLSVVPFLGPALYLLLRPSLAAAPTTLSQSISDEN